MRLRLLNVFQLRKPRRRSRPELVPEVLPLIVELPPGNDQGLDGAIGVNLLRVEAITTADSFGVNQPEVSRDVFSRCWRLEKARQLRVMPVTARLALQHRLRQ